MMRVMMLMEVSQEGYSAAVDKEAGGMEGSFVREIFHIGQNDVVVIPDRRVDHMAVHGLPPIEAHGC